MFVRLLAVSIVSKCSFKCSYARSMASKTQPRTLETLKMRLCETPMSFFMELVLKRQLAMSKNINFLSVLIYIDWMKLVCTSDPIILTLTLIMGTLQLQQL